jgi:hypothetical protein
MIGSCGGRTGVFCHPNRGAAVGDRAISEFPLLVITDGPEGSIAGDVEAVVVILRGDKGRIKT